MFHGKPIIGLAGGIGSGKSFVASLFAEQRCRVIDADQLAAAAYEDAEIRATLKSWWGEEVFKSDGQVNRKFIAGKIFTDPAQKQRLEGLVHPHVIAARQAAMEREADNAQIVAFVWDTPLLFEADQVHFCDAVVFVEAPDEARFERVERGRGWTREEWLRREKLQWPLDKKREISDYVFCNTADAGYARSQVRQVLSQILRTAD
jgi:dephospho-CoA kinase